MMLASIPLLVIPFILYNVGLTGVTGEAGTNPWKTELFSYTMVSGGVFTMTLGDALIVLALVLLFIEIFKATRTTNWSIVDHLLSTFVFVAFLVEFLLVRDAANSIFLILMVISLIDLFAGFAVSIRSARRDIDITS